MSTTDVDAIKFNIRRSSIPYNLFRRSSKDVHPLDEELSKLKKEQGDALENASEGELTPLEHFEVLLRDMNDFCEYGAEILDALKQETKKESLAYVREENNR